MDLEGLAVLCALRDEDSISAAARALGLSRTTAWRRLNALEETLGCRLVERTQRSHRLTEAGREAAGRGRAVLEQVEALREATRATHRGAQGVLKVAAPPFTERLSVQALAFAWQQLPGLRVVIHESPEPKDPLRDDFDLVATFTLPDDEGLIVQRLETLEWGLFASEGYLACHGAPAGVEALGAHPLWLHRLPGDPLDRLPCLDGGELSVSPLCATTNPSLVVSAAQEGLGLAFVPWQLLGGGGGLHRVLSQQVGRRRDLYLVAGARQRESPRVQLAAMIMDWVRGTWLSPDGP